MTGGTLTLTRTIGLADMVAYAGATWDWHRLHYDPAYLASVGLTAPVIDGQVFGALLAEVLTGRLGPGWRLSELDFRFGELVFAGETVRAEAELTVQEPDRVEARLRVVVVGAGGGQVREAVRSGRAVLVPRLEPPAGEPDGEPDGGTT